LIFCIVLIFALILTTLGIAFIGWIDDKKSHLKHNYGVVGNIILICWKFTAVSSLEKNLANRSRIDKVIAAVRVAPFFHALTV